MNFQSAQEAAKDVKGWLTKSEARILYELTLKMAGKGSIVEIGSWQGKSTIHIASAIIESEKKSRFYAVDPHIGSEEHQKEGEKVWTYDNFIENIKRANVSELVTPVVKTSIEFAGECKDEVSFAFIDGAHDCKSVKEDFDAWYPKIIVGGYMAFHDSYAGGDPYKVLRNVLYKSRSFGVIRTADSITYAEKITKNSFLVYARNVMFMFLKDFVNMLYKINFLKKLIISIKKVLK